MSSSYSFQRNGREKKVQFQESFEAVSDKTNVKDSTGFLDRSQNSCSLGVSNVSYTVR